MVRSSAFYLLLLFVFLISSLFLNAFIIGPFSIRIYVSVLVFLIFIFKRTTFNPNKEMLLYALFIFFYWLALNVNGEISDLDFAKRLLGRYLICFISFYVLYKSIISQTDINKIVIFLVFLGVLNGIVSTLQFNGNSAAYLWPTILTPTELLEERTELYQRAGSGLGIGVIGLFGAIVKNGYFSSAFALLSLFMIVLSKNFFYRTTFVLISLFLFFSIFLTQQRLVTLLSLIIYLYFYYKYFNLRYISLLFVFPMVGLSMWYFFNMLLESNSLGRLLNLKDEHRETLYAKSFQFVIDNFLFGGQIRAANYLESAGLANSAHNFVLNAFIYSGVFGAVFVIILFGRMLRKSVNAILGKNAHQNPSFFISIALIVYLLNSLTHNSSLVSGDEFIWILFAMLIKSQSIERFNFNTK
jgi:O-antigen ligase